jgi:hypothetical protein
MDHSGPFNIIQLSAFRILVFIYKSDNCKYKLYYQNNWEKDLVGKTSFKNNLNS